MPEHIPTMIEVLARPIYGNAEDDARTWRDLFAIASSESRSVYERGLAIRHTDVLTGEETPNVDDLTLVRGHLADVDQYVEAIPDLHIESHFEVVDGLLHLTAGDFELDTYHIPRLRNVSDTEHDDPRHLVINPEIAS